MNGMHKLQKENGTGKKKFRETYLTGGIIF